MNVDTFIVNIDITGKPLGNVELHVPARALQARAQSKISMLQVEQRDYGRGCCIRKRMIVLAKLIARERTR